jgi:predicted lipid carrier protein YhbT
MTTAREKMLELGEKLSARQAKAAAVGGVFRFVISGDGGGTFVMNLKDQVGVSEGDGPAACTIKMSATDFVDLFEGRASGQALFFSQRLTVEGDMAMALKLQTLTEILS